MSALLAYLPPDWTVQRVPEKGITLYRHPAGTELAVDAFSEPDAPDAILKGIAAADEAARAGVVGRIYIMADRNGDQTAFRYVPPQTRNPR